MVKRNIYEVLAGRVREHRVRLGWTQEQLGERSGLHPSYIGMIERHARKVSLLTVQRLAEALEVKISELLTEESPVRYKPSDMETKIVSVVRDRPLRQQEFVYKTIKNLVRLSSKGSGKK